MATEPASYQEDVDFLRQHTEVIELGASGDARVAIAPAYQGRVMTSTLMGGAGEGYGWINKPFIAAGEQSPVFNNYGGEDRLCLGPEAGQFGLFFEPGAPFDLEHTRCPAGLSNCEFVVVAQSERLVTMTTAVEVTNYRETTFSCRLRRTIHALTADEVASGLNSPLGNDISVVAFESVNTLYNQSREAWTRQTGLLSLWSLGMFKAIEKGKAVLPVTSGHVDELGPKVTMDYFGELGQSRGKMADNYCTLKADGLSRWKIGVSPARAKDVLGSFDSAKNCLTIVQYSLPRNACELPYVNSHWKIQEDPFAGDVINIYNDGGTADKEPTFYELETSSPAAELKPGQAISHTHFTSHFTGKFKSLNDLSKRVLEVDLKDLR
ncbi:MAG: hypothetical protein J7M14_04165 [Planctomycetes bacterium]|nr:hypothetical protein [Planctomycetota bacterium]